MKVLIWLNQFPTFSETFIRDQIINLKKETIEVVTFCNYKNDNELSALDNYSEYNLLDDRYCLEDIVPKNKFKRFYLALKILINKLFTNDFLVLLRTLNGLKFGADAYKLILFYTANFIIDHKITTIHAHFGPNGTKASFIKQIGLPIKLYTTFHGYDIRLGDKNGGKIYNTLFKYSDGVFSISPYNKQKLIDFGLPVSKIIDLPNGIDTTFFNRDKLISLNGPIKLISVARLAEEKGILIFLKALKAYVTEVNASEIIYSVIGEGPLRTVIEQYIIEQNMQKYVFLLGKKNTHDVKAHFIESDVYVLPSLAEALPTVLLEAQSCSMPILATNVGSVADMTTDSVIVEPNSVEALKNGLKQLVNNRNSWNVIGQQHRKNIIENYNIKHITAKLIHEYSS